MIEIFEPGSTDYHVCQERHEVSAAKAATLLKARSPHSGSTASRPGATRDPDKAGHFIDHSVDEMPAAVQTRGCGSRSSA